MSLHLPRCPHIQILSVKQLMITLGPWVIIMHKSEKARLTTNMLEGVRKLFTLNFQTLDTIFVNLHTNG